MVHALREVRGNQRIPLSLRNGPIPAPLSRTEDGLSSTRRSTAMTPAIPVAITETTRVERGLVY